MNKKEREFQDNCDHPYTTTTEKQAIFGKVEKKRCLRCRKVLEEKIITNSKKTS